MSKRQVHYDSSQSNPFESWHKDFSPAWVCIYERRLHELSFSAFSGCGKKWWRTHCTLFLRRSCRHLPTLPWTPRPSFIAHSGKFLLLDQSMYWSGCCRSVNKPRYKSEKEGPNAAWTSYVKHLNLNPRAENLFIFGSEREDLRSWGYVFWDYSTLESLGFKCDDVID